MTYPKPHSKLVAGPKPEFRSNDSPGQSRCSTPTQHTKQMIQRGSKRINLGMDWVGKICAFWVSSRSAPHLWWVDYFSIQEGGICYLSAPAGSLPDFWPPPSANFHSVGFRKLTINVVASKLKFYELGIKFKMMKVIHVKEIFLPVES